jgi:hypothetical protein
MHLRVLKRIYLHFSSELFFSLLQEAEIHLIFYQKHFYLFIYTLLIKKKKMPGFP